MYHLWSFSDLLLYIGKSYLPDGFDSRLERHRRTEWGFLIYRWTLTLCRSEKDALNVEREAIETERPLFNQTSNGQRGQAALAVLKRRLNEPRWQAR